jgi:capsular exopolysaccharide synthesis family protein
MAKKSKNNTSEPMTTDMIMRERRSMFGPSMNFAAAEAYKLLRTNLTFSFSGNEECRVIGVTSSFRGEGKSLTAMNLVYTIAEANKRVLLVEGDMRLPTVAKRRGLQEKPGLSNLLVGLDSISSAIQRYRVSLGEKLLSLDVMVSGDIPPNPSELLSSERMKNLLKKLRERYDYVIVDLPPVNAVTDALIASRIVDGIIVVVRNDHAVRGALAETMRQLRQAEAHVLGFVYNDASGTNSKYYSKKGYYSSNYYYK